MTDQKRSLVIDSSQELQEEFSNALKGHGYEVYVSSDGEKGFEVIEKILPDLVIVDAMAPVMDASQILKKMNDSDTVILHIIRPFRFRALSAP